MNKIFLLRAPDLDGVDEAHGFVVIALDEAQARQLAAGDPGDEGASYWQSTRATCTYVGTAAVNLAPGIVLRDFNAG